MEKIAMIVLGLVFTGVGGVGAAFLIMEVFVSGAVATHLAPDVLVMLTGFAISLLAALTIFGLYCLYEVHRLHNKDRHRW